MKNITQAVHGKRLLNPLTLPSWLIVGKEVADYFHLGSWIVERWSWFATDSGRLFVLAFALVWLFIVTLWPENWWPAHGREMHAPTPAISVSESQPSKLIALPPDTSVRDSDPKIEVEFADDRGATPSKDYVYFELINRGQQSEARFACIEDFHIGGHLVRFRKFPPPIAPFGSCANICPFDINRPDGRLSDMDIFQIFYQEWESLHRPQLREFTVPIKLTYQDGARNLFEVRCDLVFFPTEHLKHPEQPNGVRVIVTRNQKLRKVATALNPINWSD